MGAKNRTCAKTRALAGFLASRAYGAQATVAEADDCMKSRGRGGDAPWCGLHAHAVVHAVHRAVAVVSRLHQDVHTLGGHVADDRRVCRQHEGEAVAPQHTSLHRCTAAEETQAHTDTDATMTTRAPTAQEKKHRRTQTQTRP